MASKHQLEMGERQNMIVRIFDMRSPRITAFNIHEWIQAQLSLKEDDIRTIQIDGPRRRVYVKFVSAEKRQSTFQNIQGQQEYKHDNGEISIVTVELAGLGLRHVRVTNLPLEIEDSVLHDTVSKYDDVKGIKEEQWSRTYRYSVSNGIRIVEVSLRTHVSSHMIIAGHRVLITYEGQATTCYNSNEQGHHFFE